MNDNEKHDTGTSQMFGHNHEVFRLLTENSFDIVNILTENGTIVFESNATKRILGYNSGERVGKSTFEFIHPHDIEQIVTEFQELVAEPNSTKLVEFRFKHKNGSWRWLQTSGQNFLSNPQINGIIINSRDITDRKEQEYKLKEKSDEIAHKTNILNQIIETIPNPIFVKDKELKYTLFNKAFARSVIGKPKNEIIGKTVFDISPPEFAEKYFNSDIQFKNEGVDYHDYETKVLFSDNTTHDVLFYKAALKDNLNNFSGIVGVMFDITQRKRIEMALAQSEQKVTSILNNITDVVWSIKMPELLLDYISPSAERVYGYSPKALYDNPQLWYDIFHPDDKHFINERFQYLSEHKNAVFEYRIIHRNGHVVWILDKSNVIYDDNNLIVRIEGLAQDITERKNIELQIEKQNKDLINLNNDKNRFISILSHDLRNPFATLLGFSDLLLKNLHNWDIQKIENQINTINNTTQQTYQLLEQVLMWAKSQSGKLTFAPEIFYFQSIFNIIKYAVQNQTDQKNIKLISIVPEKTTLMADLNMFSTVLRNLISNAIKFSYQNGLITIDAKLHQSNIVITVSDNGVGIPKSIIPKLWEINEHYATSGTNNEAGTGFGLKLCKELIEKHGGQIWVESEPGKGSDFKFTLPLK